MWNDLVPEIEALKKQWFGRKYDQFRAVSNSFLRLLSHLVSAQHPNGTWEEANQFQVVATAHMIRLLRRLGVSLHDRWNLAQQEGEGGNLYRAIRALVNAYHEPKSSRYAYWGQDVWDDCYVLLALSGCAADLNKPEIGAPGGIFSRTFDDRFTESLSWLKEQAQEGFTAVPQSDWFGPGFYAAGIELFDSQEEREVVEKLVSAVAPILDEMDRRDAHPPWNDRFAWHLGQLIVAWGGKRKKYKGLRALDNRMQALYEELKSSK